MRRVILRVLLAPFIVLAILLALLPRLSSYMLQMVPGRLQDSPGLSSEVARYSEPGPHPVGVRNLTIDGEDPLDLWAWYPASTYPSPEGATAYPFELKMFGPRNPISIATWEGQATRAAPYDLSGGPYPLVILSPGFAIGSASYAWLAEHLASHGFVVVSPEHEEPLDPSFFWRSAVTRPRDTRAVLTYAEEQAGPGGILAGLIDTDRLALVGHSLGGYTALAAAGARLDTDAFTSRCEGLGEDAPGAWLCDALVPRTADMAELAGLDSVPGDLWPATATPGVNAVVSMAGDAYLFDRAGLAEITVPVMAVGGTRDTDTPFTWGTQPTYEFSSSIRKAKVALEGASHMIFASLCEEIRRVMKLLPNEFCSDREWEKERAHDLIRHYTTAFLLSELNQDAAAGAALAPEEEAFPGVIYEAQGYAASEP